MTTYHSIRLKLQAQEAERFAREAEHSYRQHSTVELELMAAFAVPTSDPDTRRVNEGLSVERARRAALQAGAA